MNFLSELKFYFSMLSNGGKYNLWLLEGTFGKMTNRGIIPRDFFQVCIGPDGNVRPLRFDYNQITGNINNKSLRTILTEPELLKIKNEKRRESNHYLDDLKKKLKISKFRVYKFKRSYDS